MPKQTTTDVYRWSESDIEEIKRAWKKGHTTATAVKAATGLDVPLDKLKSKLQTLQRGSNPMLVKPTTVGMSTALARTTLT